MMIIYHTDLRQETYPLNIFGLTVWLLSFLAKILLAFNVSTATIYPAQSCLLDIIILGVLDKFCKERNFSFWNILHSHLSYPSF
jgi:hypothetical protein